MPPKSLPQPAADPPPIILRYKERLATLHCPEPYDETVELWINTPDNFLAAEMTSGEILAKVIRAWSFQTDQGKPAPISLAALSALPSELIRWLWDEYVALRSDPLALPRSTPKPSATPPTVP